MEELLDSASRTVSSKVDLKSGFYTEPLQSESWHRLKEADVDGTCSMFLLFNLLNILLRIHQNLAF